MYGLAVPAVAPALLGATAAAAAAAGAALAPAPTAAASAATAALSPPAVAASRSAFSMARHAGFFNRATMRLECMATAAVARIAMLPPPVGSSCGTTAVLLLPYRTGTVVF